VVDDCRGGIRGSARTLPAWDRSSVRRPGGPHRDPGQLGHRLDSKRELRGLLTDLVEQTPRGLDLHCIVDNFSAHKTWWARS
jgi:hypothetical protein